MIEVPQVLSNGIDGLTDTVIVLSAQGYWDDGSTDFWSHVKQDMRIVPTNCEVHINGSVSNLV